MLEKKENINLKVILLGDSSVGKTSMLLRYTDDIFYDNQVSTLGIDFRKKIIERENFLVRMQIWDTAGQERFRCSIPKDFYRNANGIILLYDISSLETFNNVKNWIEKIEDTKKSIPVILIGNKSDRIDSRKVLLSEGQELAKKYDVLFFETSCKMNINIKEAFEKLVDKVIEKGNFDNNLKDLKLNKIENKVNKCCK